MSNYVYVGYFVTRTCSLQLFLVKCARYSVNPPCLSVLFINLNDCGNWNETFIIALWEIILWHFTSYLYILVFYLSFNITFLNSGNCFEIPPPTLCIYLLFRKSFCRTLFCAWKWYFCADSKWKVACHIWLQNIRSACCSFGYKLRGETSLLWQACELISHARISA